MLTGSSMSDGVLSDRELRLAVRDGWIVSPTAIDDQQFQPASLDLRLGPEAYQLRASFLPFRESVPRRALPGGLTAVVSGPRADRRFAESAAAARRPDFDVRRGARASLS